MARRWKTVHGRTHSRNAEGAESRGQMPISRAVEEVYRALGCKEHGIPRRIVREFLEANCRAGWHHVAGPGEVRRVDYYDTSLTEDQKKELFRSRKRKAHDPGHP